MLRHVELELRNGERFDLHVVVRFVVSDVRFRERRDLLVAYDDEVRGAALLCVLAYLLTAAMRSLASGGKNARMSWSCFQARMVMDRYEFLEA